jgi:hypothetical protein
MRFSSLVYIHMKENSGYIKYCPGTDEIHETAIQSLGRDVNLETN